jgi:hypothetical protein
VSLPPALLHLRVRDWPTLWLPLFLCWPLLPLLLLAVFIAVSVLDARRGPPRASAYERVVSVWQLLCATRGVRVDVEAPIRLGISIH